MNATSSSFNEPLPAAERAMRMEESLDSLEALVTTQLSGVPLLVRLLMQFFAMLRAALDKLAEGNVMRVAPAADVVAPTDEVVTVGLARTLGPRMPRMPRIARTRQARSPMCGSETVRVEAARHPARNGACQAGRKPVAKLEASLNSVPFRKKFQKSASAFAPKHVKFVTM